MAGLHDAGINDVHVHLGWSGGINNYLDPDKLDDFIAKNGIEQIALIPFERDTCIFNTKIMNLAKRNKRMHGLYWIQKGRIPEDLKVLESEIGDGFVGVKFHGSFENLPVSAEVYQPVMHMLNEKNAILLIHCGRYKDGAPESNTSFLHGLDVAKKFPNIRIILAHMGGNDTSVVKRAVAAAAPLKNVHFDISGTSTPYRIEHAVEVIGAERILFGSDYPWCSFKAMYYNVEDALITDSAKHAILRDNFVRLVSG